MGTVMISLLLLSLVLSSLSRVGVGAGSSDIEMPFGFWYLGLDGQTFWLNKPGLFRGLQKTSEEMLAERDSDGDDLEEERRMRKYLLKRLSSQPRFLASGNKIIPIPRLGK